MCSCYSLPYPNGSLLDLPEILAVFKFGSLAPNRAKKILAEFLNLAVASRSILHHQNIAHAHLSGSVAVPSFEVLELSREFADLQEI